MRETVTEYEVETVEVEEEEVYCDICTSRCTDSHEVVPMELCSGCQPEEEEQEWTMESYKEAFAEHEETRDNFDTLLFIGLFPLFFMAAVLDGLGGHDYAKFFLTPLLGLLLWTGITIGGMYLLYLL